MTLDARQGEQRQEARNDDGGREKIACMTSPDAW